MKYIKLKPETRFEQPIFLCLTESELSELSQYQLRRHRRKLKPPKEPLPPMESGEDGIAPIMEGNMEIQK